MDNPAVLPDLLASGPAAPHRSSIRHRIPRSRRR
jgi:hypothetical protein